MPLNRPNPAYGRSLGGAPASPYPYIDANGQPTNDPGTADAPTPTTSVDIAPAGSGAAPTSTPASATTTTTTAPATTAPVPGVGLPGQPGGNYQVDQLTAQARQQLAEANARIDAAWADIKPLQQQYQNLTSKTIPDPNNPGQTIPNPSYDATAAMPGGAGEQLTQQLNSKYQTLNSAMSQAESANLAYSQQVQSAIKTVTLDPQQSALYTAQAGQADAQADYLHKQGDTLTAGAQSQRDLVAAQVGSTNADANLKLVQAQVAASTAGPQQDALKAQAAQSQANADSTRALIQPNIDKLAADTTLTKAQAGLTDANSDLAKANTVKVGKDAALVDAQTEYQKAQTAAGIPAASAASLQGQAAQSQATAAKTLADIQQAKLGPTYGLQDQLNAIKSIHDQVFGPGGSGTPDQRRQQADDLMSQFFNATVGGTTPYAASVAAANAGLTAFGTQMSGVNALQAAQASRAASTAGLAGSEFGTLAQMNAYAPKGSTGMAVAFQQLQDDWARRMAAQFPTAPIPNAPPLPSYLQQFGAPAAGGQTAGPGGAPVAAGAPVGGPMGGGAAAAPVTAGASGGGPTFNPQASTAAMNTAGFLDSPAGRAAMAASNPALLGTPGGAAPPPATAPVAPYGAGPAPGGNYGNGVAYTNGVPPWLAGPGPAIPASIANYATPGGGVTPQQAFNQGLQANTPAFPNVLQMYGMNLPSPMQMLGGQTYMGMGV